METNQNLRAELLAMQEEDQRLLKKLVETGELGTVAYHPDMKAVHQKNISRIKEIIKHHGWPGYRL